MAPTHARLPTRPVSAAPAHRRPVLRLDIATTSASSAPRTPSPSASAGPRDNDSKIGGLSFADSSQGHSLAHSGTGALDTTVAAAEAALAAIGKGGNSASGRSAMMKFLTCSPNALSPCQEGCYWRWLVHTLLSEMDGLRVSLDKAHEDMAARAEERRELEQAQEHEDTMREQCKIMQAALEGLRQKVPKLREEKEQLQTESARLDALEKDLETRKLAIIETAKIGRAKAAHLEDEVLMKERLAEQKQAEERDVRSRIQAYREELEKIGIDLQFLGTERDRLRKEVEAIEAKSPKRGKGKAKPRGR